jgi:hypothetical protein
MASVPMTVMGFVEWLVGKIAVASPVGIRVGVPGTGSILEGS